MPRNFVVESFVCARETCRKPFTRRKQSAGVVQELCPDCRALIRAGRGDLLDPEMWAECQRVDAETPKTQDEIQEHTRRALKAVRRERINPLKASAFIGGERGAAKTSTKGGASND